MDGVREIAQLVARTVWAREGAGSSPAFPINPNEGSLILCVLEESSYDRTRFGAIVSNAHNTGLYIQPVVVGLTGTQHQRLQMRPGTLAITGYIRDILPVRVGSIPPVSLQTPLQNEFQHSEYIS